MQKAHDFFPDILKSCDIRGIWGKELNTNDAYYVGRSFGTSLIRLGKKDCVVGYDGRLTSIELSEEVIRGLI